MQRLSGCTSILETVEFQRHFKPQIINQTSTKRGRENSRRIFATMIPSSVRDISDYSSKTDSPQKANLKE